MSLPEELRKRIGEELARALEEHSVVFVIAPTGAGKSRMVAHNPHLLDSVGRVVHVLPLRSLVEDLAVDLACRLGRETVAFQAGIRGVRYVRRNGVCKLVPHDCAEKGVEEVDKDPYMLYPYVVTTYDSYTMTLLLAPIAEIGFAHYGHTDLGLAALATALNVYDEVHLLAPDVEPCSKIEEEDHVKPLALLAAATATVVLAGSRTTYLTATLHPDTLRVILRSLSDPGLLGGDLDAYALVVQPKWLYKRYQRSAGGLARVEHVDLAREAAAVIEEYSSSLKTRVDVRGPVEVVEELCREGGYEKVMVVLNTVERAVEVYRKLKSCRACVERYERILLLHGRMARLHRGSQLAELRGGEDGSPLLLVATQVVEAGVDLDADALVTDVAPLHSLIQRAGRVLRRKLGGRRGLVVVLAGEGALRSCERVYGVDCRAVAEKIRRMAEACHGGVDWRYGLHHRGGEGCTVYKIFAETTGLALERAADVLEGIACTIFREVVTAPAAHMAGSRDIPSQLKRLEERLGGGLLRTGISIPLVVEWRGERDLVEAPHWLATALAEKGRLTGLLVEVEGESRVLELNREGVSKLLEWIGRHPLSFPRTLSRRFSKLLGSGEGRGYARIVGFACAPGVYDDELGLTAP